MSAAVRLAGKMPGDPQINGVDELAPHLVEHANTASFVAIVIFDVAAVTHRTDEDVNVPTIRVRKIEPMGYIGTELPGIPPAPQAIQEMFLARVESRQGMAPLPFDALEAEDEFEVTA